MIVQGALRYLTALQAAAVTRLNEQHKDGEVINAGGLYS